MRVVVVAVLAVAACVSRPSRVNQDSGTSAAGAAAGDRPFLEFRDDRLVSRHEIRLELRQPNGFRAAGPVLHFPTFSGHPYAVSLAAYTGPTAFIMFHAERVLDSSGASDYSRLETFRLGDEIFRTRAQCALVTPDDVAEEHDLKFLASNGFTPTPGVYLRQLLRTTPDNNAEIVITYGERVSSCDPPVVTPAFRSDFDRRLGASVALRALN